MNDYDVDQKALLYTLEIEKKKSMLFEQFLGKKIPLNISEFFLDDT